MSKLNVNGVELELDLLDADVMEKYEHLNEEIIKKIQEPTQYEGKSTADGMRMQCRYVDEFFDELFGEGTAETVFHGGNNLGIRMDAFGIVANASDGMKKEVNDIKSKYGPSRAGNRAQKRTFDKKNSKKNYHANYVK